MVRTILNKKGFYMLLDSLVILLAGVIAYFFLNPYVALPVFSYVFMIVFGIAGYSVLASYSGICATLYRYTSIKDMLIIFISITISFGVTTTLSILLLDEMSFRYILLVYLISLLLVSSGHIVFRIFHEYKTTTSPEKKLANEIRTLVVGAGDGGNLFIKNIQKNSTEIKVVGIVDDDKTKHGMRLYNIPILGNIIDIPLFTKKLDIEQITIAIPSLKPKQLEKILEICNEIDLPVNLMPSIEDVMNGKLTVSRFREIDVVDLLGRDEVTLDTKQISEDLIGKTILVSGAGGSIGSEICRIIADFSPKKIILLGHGENSIYQIHRELNKKFVGKIEITPVIADVQNRQRMFDIMEIYKPDIVYHAAAHKHVPMMELNTFEAVRNNVFGTKNIAEAAKTAGVGTFIMISTDKAVNPPNVMGATKRIAEMIVTSLNEEGKTNFAAVRFGNVLGSRGSVVPLFKEQIKAGGPVTVTDFRMTRYFMTIPEASRLVIQAGTLAKGGEIFVLDMGQPVKIVDLAKKVIKLSGFSNDEIQVIETGIRPGEKLYEELLIASENTGEKVYDKIFVGKAAKRSIEEVMLFLKTVEGCTEASLKDQLISFAKAHQKAA
ncbi:NDP-sugar epimerase, includes UDP-GlcNAc-inverting 4,6-dehydratase FlaA1 and capsular polysaccharide biosynthesis protein EpsC [Carnobacterium alterfunditum]|uniref:NDP-sugar epimerase, includes UDP-GlcNAc-inverting 4,6-dehydratase FlaA1 and capsular polysaccharide biosynthesis protein EpsC n=1 Tax=Carnobacterium alterfunditum TaxID=28230 RepID=A0A1N6HD58_9LACT|nr:nucleoside-diphosphate sugar epimerase/dehydratase [Carnobacterium alterfunditum]SIO17722.1 NDP-sugar epimerase, includes UDP-GlcNAc-inverting 4,6-dehydratase FlaA1 and capsular polysaccharide biosynthesis protein EpsC [Carnobacterium alterfunditum]